MPNPLEHAELYDSCELEGFKTPALIYIAGASRPRKWDEKKGYGQSGDTIVYTGDGRAKPVIKCFAWTAAHFEAWAAWDAAVLEAPPNGAKPKAKDIRHPELNRLGINSVVVEDDTQWEQTGHGMWTREIKLQQYRAPKPSLGKPSGSNAKGWEQGKQTGDEYDKMIDDLTKQVKGL